MRNRSTNCRHRSVCNRPRKITVPTIKVYCLLDNILSIYIYYVYRVTTGHHGSCRVCIPFPRIGLGRVNEFRRQTGSCRVIAIGNVWCVARLELPGWLTQATMYTFAFIQALLHDPPQFVCSDLYVFQIALAGAGPCVPRLSQVQVSPGPGGFHVYLCFTGFCMCGSWMGPRQFVFAALRSRLC